MLVLSFCLDIEVHASSIAKTLEEMEEHLGGHLADAFATEIGIPYQPWPSSKVECHRTETVVHGQAVAITLNASFVAQSL